MKDIEVLAGHLDGQTDMFRWYHCKACKKKISIIQILYRDRDKDIFDLQDQVTKVFIIVFWATIAYLFVLKVFICLVACSQISSLDANYMSHKFETPSSIYPFCKFLSDGMY